MEICDLDLLSPNKAFMFKFEEGNELIIFKKIIPLDLSVEYDIIKKLHN